MKPYENIYLDFDGVICDSNFLKSRNIFTAANCYLSVTESAVFHKYFIANNGVPREKKIFQYFQDNVLAQNILDKYIKLNKNLTNAIIVPGLIKFLKQNTGTNIIVLSGGDFKEIDDYLVAHSIRSYFSLILAGPKTKNEHLTVAVPASRSLFIADTMYDYNVAKEHSIDFIFLYGYTQDITWQECLPSEITRVANFNELISI